MRDHLSFVLNGEVVRLRGFTLATTLLTCRSDPTAMPEAVILPVKRIRQQSSREAV